MQEKDISEPHRNVAHNLYPAELGDQEVLADLELNMEDQAADQAIHAEIMQRLPG